MRVKEDLRRCVLFLGYEGQKEDEIEVVGTGFVIAYGGYSYTVTAGHVAKGLGGDPFVVRVNERTSGRGVNFHVDDADWYFHPNFPEVDLAILPGAPQDLNDPNRFELASLGNDFILSPDEFERREHGPGDRVHIVGLFRLLYGKKRNLPIVHTGWIAMVPDDEAIPVCNGDKTIHVNGYLVEAQTLHGLSGAPVFVEQTWRHKIADDQVAKVDTWTSLLGVWQAAWAAPPDDILAREMGQKTGVAVPVGMGIVVPAIRIVELLDTPDLAKMRDKLN